MTELARRARLASRRLTSLSGGEKNDCLLAMADAIEANAQFIQQENAKDMDAGAATGLSKALLDRLLLDEARIGGMVTGLREVSELPDPVGRVIEERTRPNGLRLTKVAAPIGVIVIIYESRPNVTADAASLCFKSGNATILRGGTEAINSNQAIAKIMGQAATQALPEFPMDAIQVVPTTDRAAIPNCFRSRVRLIYASREAARVSFAPWQSVRRCRSSSITRACAMFTLTAQLMWQWRRKSSLTLKCTDPAFVTLPRRCSSTRPLPPKRSPAWPHAWPRPTLNCALTRQRGHCLMGVSSTW